MRRAGGPRRARSVAAGACLTAALPAAAQLADVVVSARRDAQQAFDAPASLQALDAPAIRAAGPQVNLSEALNRIPGVVVLNRQNYAQDLQLSIRGFGARSTFGIRGVRLIVDGIPATMPDGQGQASTISLPSAARIEVLRGPLAQLYGNAAGGVVQVFTERGASPPYAEASAAIGSFDTRRYGLKASGRGDALEYLADYSDFSTDGYRDHSAATRRHLNTRWQFALSPATQLALVGNFFDQPWAQDPLGLTHAQYQANPRQSVPLARQQDAGKAVDQRQAGLLLQHRLSDDARLEGRLYHGRRDVYQKLSIPPAAQQAPTASGGIVALDREYWGTGLRYAHGRRVESGRIEVSIGFDHDSMREHRRGFLNVGGRAHIAVPC
ncbi:MAG TPA: TonB-dependent receptor plug domain-containing protein, partial [Burkholderiaceae bacterium]|nr:TonB-dependent receptor plug domain-containing protein [Burkholderiaceae bacterium]